MMPHEPSDEVRYRFLKFVSEHPEATQREVARELGVSLGKANYCLRALISSGMVKLERFARSGSKAGYTYLLTANGLRERANAGRAFLQRRIGEYELLTEEIRALRREVDEMADRGDTAEETG